MSAGSLPVPRLRIRTLRRFSWSRRDRGIVGDLSREARDIRLYQNQLQKLDARAQNMTPDEQKTIKQAEDLQVRQAAGATLTPAEQDIVDKAKPLLLRGGINSNTIATTAALRQNVRRAALRLGHVLDDRELADISRAGELEVQAAPALKNKAEGKELSDQEKHTLDELAATKGRIGDTATRLGVSVDDVRKLNIDERRGGVSVEDVIAAHKVYDYQSEQAKEQRDLIQKPGMDVATSLLDAYGMSVDSRTPEGRAKLQQLSAIMQTEHGREITASLVSGRKELLKVGREKGGIKDADDEKAFMQLYEEYENGGVKGREMFANKYGEAAVSRMELQAAIEGLRILKERCEVDVITDSEYVMNGITSWVANWKKRGWLTAAKKPVVNRDLWEELDAQVGRHAVKWSWTKGHASHEDNNRADELASRAAREQRSCL